MNFGKKLLELRKNKNITQDELASELGVTAAAVSKWENNNTLPDILMLSALADYFQVTTDELLGRAKQWRYGILAAQTLELGQKMEYIAKNYGIAVKAIYPSFEEADEAAAKDNSLFCLLAGFHGGTYGSKTGLSTFVSVAPTDQEVLDGFALCLEKYLT